MKTRFYLAWFLLTGALLPTYAQASAGWLSTNQNHIIDSAGNYWHGIGVNLLDPEDNRSCVDYSNYPSAPTSASAFNPNNAIARMDQAVNWGANTIRLMLDSSVFPSTGSLILNSNAYMSAINSLVVHSQAYNNVYVIVQVWLDPTAPNEIPTSSTGPVLSKLVDNFYMYPNVIFGIMNEPQTSGNSTNANVWQAMNSMVATIRAEEVRVGSPQHLISVPANYYPASVSYYASNPITSYGGNNIIYDYHTYFSDSIADYNTNLLIPARTIPVIVGEYGPASTNSSLDYQCGAAISQSGMTVPADVVNFQSIMRANSIPYLAWAFDENAGPNLLAQPGGACSNSCLTPNYTPTSWGTVVYNDLQSQWIPTPGQLSTAEIVASVL